MEVPRRGRCERNYSRGNSLLDESQKVMVIKISKDGAAKVKGAEVQAKDEDRWPTP